MSMTQPRPITHVRIIQRVLALFWNRRYLVFTPLMLALPLGILLSIVLPRTYVASTLLLLQESGSSSFLGSSSPMQPYQSQDRFNGLQALLKSDRVLRSVVAELERDAPPQTARLQSLAIDRLKSSINLSQLNSEMIEIRLRGPKSEGLGKTLEIITARLLESLLSPEEVVVTAPQLIVEHRRSQLVSSQKAYQAFLHRLQSDRPEGSKSSPAASSESIDDLRVRAAALRANLGLKDATGTSLETSIDHARARVAEGAAKNDAPRLDIAIAQRQLDQLVELRDVEGRIAAHPDTSSRPGENKDLSIASTIEEAAKLYSAVQIATEKFNDAERRFGTRLAGVKFQILRAPEQITIIDPPKDPEFPTLSRTIIILSTLALAGIFGLGAALIADFADPRIRSIETLSRLTGAPVWGRLPAAR